MEIFRIKVFFLSDENFSLDFENFASFSISRFEIPFSNRLYFSSLCWGKVQNYSWIFERDFVRIKPKGIFSLGRGLSTMVDSTLSSYEILIIFTIAIVISTREEFIDDVNFIIKKISSFGWRFDNLILS